MFEGKSLLTYFELGQELRLRHNISETEYNASLPWHVDVKWSLIMRDIEEKKARMRNQNPFSGMG